VKVDRDMTMTACNRKTRR
jgi:hypothetical protein